MDQFYVEIADISDDYEPSEKEPFMNDSQREYFRRKLLSWRKELLDQSKETLIHLQQESSKKPDIADQATVESDQALELRARDRQRKLINKIESALRRIHDETYGYCDDTGEAIALKRLIARPIATLSLEAQEAHERKEKFYRDD